MFNRLNNLCPVFIRPRTNFDFMNNHIIAGLIECGAPGKSYLEVEPSFPQGLHVKKAYVAHEGARSALSRRYPELELTADCEAIFEDESIGLVLISSPEAKHRNLIGTALRAKKQVQIV